MLMIFFVMQRRPPRATLTDTLCPDPTLFRSFAGGVPWHEALDAGSFLGQKIVLNEFVAFADFAPQAGEFSEKSRAVITFALTGFANLGSLAILLGGLGGIAPTQRSRIAELGLRAVLAGTLANLMRAAIAGVLVG